MAHQRLDLVNAPVPRLIWQLAAPASVGVFFNSLYNLTDTFFGGMISAQALAALAMGFPVFFAVIATSMGMGQGSTALVAAALGNDDENHAILLTAQAMLLGLISSIAVGGLGLLVAPTLFRAMGAEGEVLSLGLAYMEPILWATPIFVLTSVANASLMAAGDTKSYRNILMGGAVVNLVLDPWLIYGGFGMPAFGFAGVALATVLVQLGSCAYLIWRSMQLGLICPRSFKLLRPRPDVLSQILANAAPAAGNMALVGLGIFVITALAGRLGDAVVAGYGVATRIEQIALLPTMGLNMATLAIVGQSFGAGRYERAIECVKTATKGGCIGMVAAAPVLYLLREQAIGIFTDAPEVIVAGAGYLAVAAFVLWVYVVLFVSMAALQGVQRPGLTFVISLARQLVLPVALFPLLIERWGANGLWFGIAGVNTLAALVCWVLAARVLRKR